MALYAEVRKIEEDEQQVRYAYTDVSGTEHTLRLDKVAETIRPETGRDDMLFRAVAGKIASARLHGADAPDRFIVQS
ncbi:hypothetical protein [Nocardia abscessus]|uniref:hypothetical protein n=1 Tax=Nocardia abscessus TaxID=120957 RepID=UPI0002FE0250|nr:hypothetical protein [Nocardia abscessus]MCC3328968.1 hypothetical protein [Nocardia abscessus]